MRPSWVPAGYDVSALLGFEPESETWRSTRSSDGTAVVVRRLLGAAADVPELRRVAAVVGAVGGPHLAEIHDVLAVGADAIVVREFVPRSLEQVEAEDLEPLVSVLAELHRRGVAHGNLSRANLLLRPDGCPVVVDVAVSAPRADPADDRDRLLGLLSASARCQAPAVGPVSEPVTPPGRRRRRWAAAVLAAVAVIAVVRVVSTADASGPPPTAPRASMSPTAPAIAPPTTSEHPPVDWAAVLTTLTERRAHAIRRVDPRLLRQVYVPRAVGLRRDLAALRALTLPASRLRAPQPTYRSVHVRRRAVGSVTLDAVTDYPGRAARSRWRFVLQRYAGEWRVASVDRVSRRPR